MEMTRIEAIQHVFELATSVASEFACSGADNQNIEDETTAALLALGVRPEEIDEARAPGPPVEIPDHMRTALMARMADYYRDTHRGGGDHDDVSEGRRLSGDGR
jgi:hypothetical protein